MNEQWIIEGPDESVGIFGWAVQHEATPECTTVSVEDERHSLHAVCSCGAEYFAEEDDSR